MIRGQFNMSPVVQVFLLCVVLVWGEPTKRDTLQPGLEYLHLAGFGPVSRLPSHPVFAHLGLTPQQAVGFINILHQNGFLVPHALKLVNGQPFVGDFHLPPFPGFVYDPYFFYLISNYGRFLPYGLGPQGIYGSTGLPKPRPLGVFKHPDKN